MNDKPCISCGMPIRSVEEAAGGVANRPYCHHCANDDGTMKSYDDVLAGMTQFMVRGQGIDESVAHDMAVDMMARLPAWADH